MKIQETKNQYAISKIIYPVNTKYGAPMGRSNAGEKPSKGKIFDRKVPMCTCCGAYDKGGAYFGIGKQLRVEYTKDLSYVRFYRVGEN
jgi:hypothetical protein